VASHRHCIALKKLSFRGRFLPSEPAFPCLMRARFRVVTRWNPLTSNEATRFFLAHVFGASGRKEENLSFFSAGVRANRSPLCRLAGIRATTVDLLLRNRYSRIRGQRTFLPRLDLRPIIKPGIAGCLLLSLPTRTTRACLYRTLLSRSGLAARW
jgi:hypothetical protein